jgi:phage terminase small subunit
MGLRGPKPKSAELESAQGFPGHRKRKTKAAKAAKVSMQQPASDSGSVPPKPPAQLWRKAARAIWVELTTNPATVLWFKRSDHNLIARYCMLEADFRALSKRLPPISIMTTTTAGDKMPKRNPDHKALLELSRELRALEAQIGGTPLARLGLAAKMGLIGETPARDGQTATPPPPQQAEVTEAPTASPVGILRNSVAASTKLN